MERVGELRFRRMVESIKDYAIFMLDSQGYVATWNPGAQRIKQYRAEEIIGQHFSRFYLREDVDAGKCEMELREAAEVGRFEDEGWRVRKDGTTFWANVVITALRDDSGCLIGFGKVTRDLTEHKRAEEDRAKLLKAQEAIRLRDEFLSIASHELKTPLTSMQLQVSGIQRNLRRSDSGRDPKLVARIDRLDHQVQRLADLINDLLDISRAAAGHLKLELAECDLERLVRDAVDRLKDQIADSRCSVSLELDGPIIGMWDSQRIDQVVTNLLTNALKYGRGGRVAIEAGIRDGRAFLRVRDHGIGIPAADQSRIFERFTRAAPVEHYGGLGIGLWIVKEILNSMGGTIAVVSQPGQGAAFTVELPLDCVESYGDVSHVRM
jgi:PAS domain S-box-containing protein